MKNKVVIAGAGGIGRAAGLIIAVNNAFNADVYIGDLRMEVAELAAEWIREGSGGNAVVHPFKMPMAGSDAAMDAVLQQGDVILDCLPGSQAPRMAKLAKENKMHYANLTEYVQETNEVVEIAKGAETGFVLQTGLAPGFINVLGMKLYNHFTESNGVEVLDEMNMKVGALTQFAESPHFYGFTWSPVGVATEYLKDAIVVRDFKRQTVPALSGIETIIIEGTTYEDNFTSGGAADLPDALAGKVKNLDYKTLRYPGHYSWVQKVIYGIRDNDERIKTLQELMLKEIPIVEDDEVVIYCSVAGKDSNGMLRSYAKAYKIPPMMIGTKKVRAIQSTTAAPLVESARMLLEGNWKGPIFQSQIDPDAFLNGPIVSEVYGKWK